MTPADRVQRVSDEILDGLCGYWRDVGNCLLPSVRTVEVLLDLRDARQREAAKDATIAEQAAEIARLKRDAATREREALSSCSLADLQMELHMRALKVLGNPWESVQSAPTPPQEAS